MPMMVASSPGGLTSFFNNQEEAQQCNEATRAASGWFDWLGVGRVCELRVVIAKSIVQMFSKDSMQARERLAGTHAVGGYEPDFQARHQP